MGGDPIPGIHEPLVNWFEEYKATLPKVIFSLEQRVNRFMEGRKK